MNEQYCQTEEELLELIKFLVVKEEEKKEKRSTDKKCWKLVQKP